MRACRAWKVSREASRVGGAGRESVKRLGVGAFRRLGVRTWGKVQGVRRKAWQAAYPFLAFVYSAGLPVRGKSHTFV